jgi:hypothetical protein
MRQRVFPRPRRMYLFLHRRRLEVQAQRPQGNKRKNNKRKNSQRSEAGGGDTLSSQGASVWWPCSSLLLS